VDRTRVGPQGVPKRLGWLLRFGKVIAGWAFRWQSRLEVHGVEHIPNAGSVIIAANHRSMLDVPLVVLACPRPAFFMAKASLFTDPFRRWLFHALAGFPVRRDGFDRRATETALALLRRGDVVGIYPEGKRSLAGQMLPFLRGAAWLALYTGTPLVPCGVRGTEGKLVTGRRTFRKRVRLTFGEPIPVDLETNAAVRRAKAAELTQQLLGEIQRLMG
jgi:1-acyl-sn-glycerol-3-phosphate acyltransferase